MPDYLFLLCPPYTGSTVLWKLIATSDSVSTLPKEGQMLPEVKDEMREEPWNPENRFPWEKIKKVWHQYWDDEKPILVEKSPALIVRADKLTEYFDPVHFIVMVRDPYAHAEGLMRRNGWSPSRSAQFALKCLRIQRRNAEKLATVVFTYEQFCEKTNDVVRRIEDEIPSLSNIDYDLHFESHSIDGIGKRPITNYNSKKLSNLKPSELKEINRNFRKGKKILQYWGYDLREKIKLQYFRYACQKIKNASTTFLRRKSQRWVGLANG